MPLSSQIDDYEKNLDKISLRLIAHTKTAQETVDSDQYEVLQRLRDGVESVKTTVKDVRTIKNTETHHVQDNKATIINCQVCKQNLKGIYFECYNCETTGAAFLAGKTNYCQRCSKSPPCKIGYHFPALRSVNSRHWRLKAPLPFVEVFEADWLKCDICSTVMSDPEVKFSWCVHCVGESVGTFCRDCTTKGYRCLVNEHEPPMSRLEKISDTKLLKNMSVLTIESLDTELTSEQEASLKKRSLQIHDCFGKLSASAEKQLDDIMEINEAAIELEDELDGLRNNLDKAALEVSSAIAGTQLSLTEKQEELETAEKKVKEFEVAMGEISRKIESNKEDRSVLRVARVAAWGSAVFFPPAALLASAMEIGNLELRDRKVKMKAQHGELSTSVSTHTTSIQTLQSEESSLKSALETKEKLSDRCTDLSWDVLTTKDGLVIKQRDYQILKDAAGKFCQWTEGLHSRTDLVAGFMDGGELRDGLRDLITDLMRCEGKSVKDICDGLKGVLGEGSQEKAAVSGWIGSWESWESWEI